MTTPNEERAGLVAVLEQLWDEVLHRPEPSLSDEEMADAILASGWLVARKSEARREALDEAHDMFCHMRSYCSIHLRPGDRHLLFPLLLPAMDPKDLHA